MTTTKLIIFDLDGTLLDTVADLACSVNHALALYGFPTHEVEAYKHFVGNGVNKLLERALPESAKTPENIARIKDEFRAYYDVHNTERTKPYEGIRELLHALQNKGIMIAVASNKYHSATESLIARLFPEINFAAVFGQREGMPPKPDPTIVFDILNITGVGADETLYVGDSGVDMMTANNSGCRSVGVVWGFRPREELINAGACHIAETPNQILSFMSSKPVH
jgi:phosphoglycolate phosphatase